MPVLLQLTESCFLWAGDGRWLVLPLLPKVRDPKATPEDAGYYIEQGTVKHRSFPDTREIEPKKRAEQWTWKKRKVDQGDGGGDLGKAQEGEAVEESAG